MVMAEAASAIDAEGTPSSPSVKKNDDTPATDDPMATKQPLDKVNERNEATMTLPSTELNETTHATTFSRDNVKASVNDGGKERQEVEEGNTNEHAGEETEDGSEKHKAEAKGKKKDDEASGDEDENTEPVRRPKETLAEFNKRMWKSEIDRSTVLAYRGRNPLRRKYPQSVLQVFYIRKPDTSNTSETEMNNAMSILKGDHEDTGGAKNIQRIMIHSESLAEELDTILGVSTTNNPLIVAPPYKYLVSAYHAIPARLENIKEEIQKANGRIATTEKLLNVSRTGTLLVDNKADEVLTEISTDESPSLSTTNQPSLASISDSVSRNKPNSRIKTETDQRDKAEFRYTQLKLLYDFMTAELAHVLELRKRIADGTTTHIRFDDLWHLFNPGERIFSDENGHKQLYTVYAITGGLPVLRQENRQEASEMDFLRNSVRRWRMTTDDDEDEEEQIEQRLRGQNLSIGSSTPLKIDCYYVSYDGEYCGPVEESKKIAPYSGEREITDLSVFPLRFHPEHNSILAELEARGKKTLFSKGHKSYEGYTLAIKPSDSRLEVQSDIYVDFKAYYDDYPLKKPRIGNLTRSRQDQLLVEEKFHDFMRLSGHEIDTMRSDEYLTTNRRLLERKKAIEDKVPLENLCLVHHYALAYVFQVRMWGQLEVDLIQDIDQESAEARTAGFKDLVIPLRYRDLLVALVDSHLSGFQRVKERSKKPPTQVDLVRGKGQGLIVLLHGPPGAGKTSTAETIAAYTRRPLYSITCGDLGTLPETVETRLLAHTKRADRWGCVLLLDEADVFLGRRDWNNTERNALVSIFLRQLEYYAGILFLTTNRLGGIDEAFKSRVHISLRYPSIDLSSTNQMWSNIMNRIEKDNKDLDVKVTFNRESLLEFAQRHFEKCQAAGVTWNGRQIRNAFQTALALGHHERLTKIKEAGLTADEAMATGKKKWRVVKLTKANFQSIAKTSREFEEYIASVRGDDTTNAVNDELRRDDYDPERPKARKSYPAPRVQAGSSKGKKAVRREQLSSEEEDEDEDDEDEDGDDESDEREDSN